jgi:prophage maintenance system killer protein
MSVLSYHLERDNRYSLASIADNKQDVVQWTTENQNRVAVEQDTVGNDTYYMIYRRSETEPPLKNLTEDEIIKWLNENFTSGEQQALVAIVRAFNGIVDEVEDEDRTLTLYKQSNFEKIPDILESVTWKQDVPSVAGELLSQFILQHPMPNANHRTGIAFMSRYLATIADSFEMVDTGEDGSWYRWARSYIHDSKQIGTLRRKTALFRHAHKQGYDTVRRKEGIEIDLRECELGRNDFYDYYQKQHTDRSIEFVRTVLDETGYEDPKEESDDGKAAFLQRLSGD